MKLVPDHQLLRRRKLRVAQQVLHEVTVALLGWNPPRRGVGMR
jgi:hypothetical protein